VLPDIVWIVIFYAAAAGFARWLVRRNGSRRESRHYVLVAGNHQSEIEGHIRALRQYSRRTGTDIGITVVLDRSTDDTAPIVERMARGRERIDWVRKEAFADIVTAEAAGGEEGRAGNPTAQGLGSSRDGRSVVWIDLALEDDLRRLPR